MTSAILIALARDPYGFEADGQEDCECVRAFLSASKCVKPNK